MGTYGPFQVTDPGAEETPYPIPNISRLITVPQTLEADPTDSLALPFTVVYAQPGYKWASVEFPCYTDYDPSQMYASLWQVMSDGTDVCLWSQMNGGVKGGGGDIDLSVISQNYYFLVTVVPETSGLVAILVGLCAAAFWALRPSKAARLVTMALLLAAIGGSAFASLSTSDLIVLYNSAGPNDYYDRSVSKSIADAYVQARLWTSLRR